MNWLHFIFVMFSLSKESCCLKKQTKTNKQKKTPQSSVFGYRLLGTTIFFFQISIKKAIICNNWGVTQRIPKSHWSTMAVWKTDQSVWACVCVPTQNIYDSSVVMMAFCQTPILSPHTKTALISAKPPDIQRSRRVAALQLYREANRLVVRLSSHMVSAAGAAEPRLEPSTLSTLLLLLMLLVSPPRLPVSSPRLFPSGSVPSGPGQEGGHNAAQPPPWR